MLDWRQDTIFLVLLTRALPHMLDNIWAKEVYLSLIRPQDMVPVIHALRQVAEEVSFWDYGHANRLVAVCGGTDKLTFLFCNLLQMIFEASFCTWRTAWGLNFFDWPLRGLFQVEPFSENLCMTLAYTVTQLGCYWSSYSLDHLWGEKQF